MLRIKQLIIVAGPSGAGKSTLIEKIRDGDATNLSDQLGIDLSSSYLYLDARMLPQMDHSAIDRLILHYDFIEQYTLKNGFAYLPELIEKSHNIVLVTLCTSKMVLNKRITSRLTKNLLFFLYKPSSHKMKVILSLWKKKYVYNNTSKLLLKYRKWSNFIEQYNIEKHLILDSTGPKITTAKPYTQNKIKILIEGKSSTPLN